MSDVENLIIESDDNVVAVIVVTCSVAKAAEAQHLVTGEVASNHRPFFCSDPV